MITDKRIFDSIEGVENYLGVPVSIPKDIPEDCNILCYSETTGEAPCFYKECGSLIYYIDTILGVCWKTPRRTLEEEVAWDKCYGYKLAYLRLATEDKFNPDCLLGCCVYGYNEYDYIVKVISDDCVLLESGYYFSLKGVAFYISDDNDDTVTFDEYVDMFYERG